eukprot:2680582-Pyramimonas_sp.AAC.1
MLSRSCSRGALSAAVRSRLASGGVAATPPGSPSPAGRARVAALGPKDAAILGWAKNFSVTSPVAPSSLR